MNQFIEKGREILSEALAHEDKKQYQQALDKYYIGIKHFMVGLKYVEGNKTKEQVKKYINEYLEKAERIKELINGRAVSSLTSSSTTNSSGGAKINSGTSSSPSSTATATNSRSLVVNSQRKKTVKVSSTNNQPNEKNQMKSKQQNTEEWEGLHNVIRSCIVDSREEIPWSEVIGMDGPKETINEALLLPRQFPQLFVGERKPIRTILLYGPPGTGKSFFVKAVASNMKDVTFFSVSSSDIVSKYMGESEKLVKALFEEAKKRQPSIIFIDEIDAVGSAREGLGGGGSSNESISRLKTELLLKVQEVLDMKETGIILIGATNRPTDLDPALRRRFQKRIYIPLPDENARKQLFRVNLEGVEVEVTPNDIDQFSKLTNHYSGADIGIIVRDALMKPVREAMNSDYFKTTNDGTIVPCSANERNSKKMNMLDIQKPEKLKIGKVKAQDLYNSIKSVKPSTNPSELLSFIEFTQNYGESESGLEQQPEDDEPFGRTNDSNQNKRKNDSTQEDDHTQEIGTATALVQKPKRKKYL